MSLTFKSLSLKTLSLIFSVILLFSLNVAALLSASVFDFLYAGLSHLVPTQWTSKSYAHKSRLQQNKLKQLGQKNRKLKSRNQTLVRKHKRLKTRTARVVKSIQRRTKKLVAATLAEMPAEAVPFLGTSVIVASAAYEVHTACATLKDLHQLEMEFSPDKKFDNTVCGIKVPNYEEIQQSILSKSEDIVTDMNDWLEQQRQKIPE